MKKLNDGGPAFPQASPDMVIPGQSERETQGMTLRDYFAAKWLAGLAAFDGLDMTTKEIAEACYRVADTMLAAREQKKKP